MYTLWNEGRKGESTNQREKTNSKWFMKSIGHEGLNNLLAAYEDKSAQAVATFGFSRGAGQEPLLFQGKTDVSLLPSFFFSLLPPFILLLLLLPKSKRWDANHRGKIRGKSYPPEARPFSVCRVLPSSPPTGHHGSARGGGPIVLL